MLPIPPRGDAVPLSYGPERACPTGAPAPPTEYPRGHTSAVILTTPVRQPNRSGQDERALTNS